MRPGSGQGATETRLNPAGAPGRFLRPHRQHRLPARGPAGRPREPGSAGNGPPRRLTGAGEQAQRARPFLPARRPPCGSPWVYGWAGALCRLPPSRVSPGGAASPFYHPRGPPHPQLSRLPRQKGRQTRGAPGPHPPGARPLPARPAQGLVPGAQEPLPEPLALAPAWPAPGSCACTWAAPTSWAWEPGSPASRARAGVPKGRAAGAGRGAVSARAGCEMGARSPCARSDPPRAPARTPEAEGACCGFCLLPRFLLRQIRTWRSRRWSPPAPPHFGSSTKAWPRGGKGRGPLCFVQGAPAQINFSKFRENKAASLCAFR